MSTAFILWNLVNLIDAEGGWLIKLVGTLVAAALVTHFLKLALDKLHLQFKEKNRVWQDTFVRALCHPIRYYIWFVVIAHSVNLVSDRLISEHFSGEIKLLFSILAVLAVSWFLLRWKKNLLEVFIEKQKTHEIAIDTGRLLGFGKLATAFILVMTALLLMEVSGQSFQTLLAFGGISGLALAIASQDIIGNFFGGLMVYITRPFTVSDFIRLPSSNLEGHVEEIGWYQTRLRNSDKRPVYIPNALFSKAFVINDSRKTHRRLCETVAVRHADLFLVPKIIREVRLFLESNLGIDKQEKIIINIAEVSPYSVNIVIIALSVYTEEGEFLLLRDELFLKTGQIIDKVGAKIATAMHSFVHKTEEKHEESAEEEETPFVREVRESSFTKED